MAFPLSFQDLGLWLAITAIVLLITAELTSPYYGYGENNLIIERKRLARAALAITALFMMIVILRVYEILMGV